jgi:hypothetical protein
MSHRSRRIGIAAELLAAAKATHDPEGVLHGQRFWAKYSRSPNFGGSGRHYGNDGKRDRLNAGSNRLVGDILPLLIYLPRRNASIFS